MARLSSLLQSTAFRVIVLLSIESFGVYHAVQPDRSSQYTGVILLVLVTLILTSYLIWLRTTYNRTHQMVMELKLAHDETRAWVKELQDRMTSFQLSR